MRAPFLSFFFILALAAVQAGCADTAPLYEGQPEHVRQRHVVLEGAANFRDLGGYATEDGRTVKWKTFYRSDKLADLTDADLEKLAGLGLRLVCDFRGPEEWQEEPDRLPTDPAPEVAHLEIWDPSFSSKGFQEAMSDSESELDLANLLVEGNRRFAGQFADRYAAMFERITRTENLPVVVHCTAGKDRAGFASALILRTLGVPMETVYEDFLLTNHYTAERIEEQVSMIRLFSLFRVPASELRAVMGVERRYLEAAFAEIEVTHGDFDSYRRDALKLSDAEVATFRALGLE
jgi:protein-tyrosine phosphatase